MSDAEKPGGLAERLPAAVTKIFRPERLLAQGGYGDVWLAYQVALNRPVALKVLQADAVTDPEELKRFQAEARIAASLSHPNIVIVLDHGVDDGVPWIAYEYVKGRSLRDIADDGPVSWPVALDATRQAARALACAHEAGVLHRDIKPENVLEAARAHYKVTDFGIAKWTGQGRAKTQTGALMGSPSYISPEQILNQPLTPACDIYGLGCMLFELLTGELPFPGHKMADVLNAHLNRPAPRVSAVKPGLPPQLDPLVARALEKDPAARYASAAEFREALDLFIGSSDALQLPDISKELGDGGRPAREIPVPAAAVRAFADPARPSRPVALPGASGVTRVAGSAASRARATPALVLGAFALLGLVGFAVHRARAPATGNPASSATRTPRIARVELEPDGLTVSLDAPGGPVRQKFAPRAEYPRALEFQLPDAQGGVASATLTTDAVAAELLAELDAVPRLLAALPPDDWLRKLGHERKKLDEATLRDRVAAGLPAPLIRLWKLAAVYGGGVLGARALPLETSARLLERVDMFADLTLRLRGFQLPAPVGLEGAYAPQWWPYFDATPPPARAIPCDIDPGMPIGADARALLQELHAAPSVGGMQLPAYMVCAQRDYAGRPIARDRAQAQLGKLVRDWAEMGILTASSFDMNRVRVEEVMPFRHRLTVSLPAHDGPAWISASLRPRLLATLRITLNGQVAIRLAQREAVDLARAGGITLYHAIDARALRAGPNELLVEGVSLNASADEPPWTGFDSLAIGLGKTH